MITYNSIDDAFAGIGSGLERAFDTLWVQLGGVDLERELKARVIFPNCTRKFRFDRGHLESKVLIELDGGTWGITGAKACHTCGLKQLGGHSTGLGSSRDADKGNLASINGWRLFRFTTDMVEKPDRYILPLVKLVAEAGGN